MELRVRRLEWDDLTERVRWFNTPEVHSQMPIETPIGFARTQQWFRDKLFDNSRCDVAFVAQTDPSTEGPYAFAGLTNMQARDRRAELYVVVRPGETGLGIGSAAVKWLCNYGFVHLGLRRIMAFTLASNSAARRFYERLGFVEEGILREHLYYHGQFVNRHLHALLRKDWEEQPWRTSEHMSFSVDTRR